MAQRLHNSDSKRNLHMRDLTPNWLENAAFALRRNLPHVGHAATPLAERLGRLLIALLPADTSRKLIRSLDSPPHTFFACVSPSGDRSISYTDFVDCAMEGLTFSALADETNDDQVSEISHRAADIFLTSVGNSLPDDACEILLHELPVELIHKMGLEQARRAA